jgi:hypothetical protein
MVKADPQDEQNGHPIRGPVESLESDSTRSTSETRDLLPEVMSRLDFQSPFNPPIPENFGLNEATKNIDYSKIKRLHSITGVDLLLGLSRLTEEESKQYWSAKVAKSGKQEWLEKYGDAAWERVKSILM